MDGHTSSKWKKIDFIDCKMLWKGQHHRFYVENWERKLKNSF